jgi:predicted GNAT family N-acyltransferase
VASVSWSIARATSREELEEIFRFRYTIYVEEMRRPQLDADHQEKRIEDRLDAWGRNFRVTDDNGIVAVVRGNFFRDGSDAEYESMYAPCLAGTDHPDRTCMVTRLMLAKSVRRSPLALNLFLWLYRYALEHDVRWIFLDCNRSLVPFFEGFGFSRYINGYEHKEYGLVTPMRIDLLDREHLKAIDSPFLRASQPMPKALELDT